MSTQAAMYLPFIYECCRCDKTFTNEQSCSSLKTSDGRVRIFCDDCTMNQKQTDPQQFDLVLQYILSNEPVTLGKVEQFLHKSGIPYSKMDAKFILDSLGYSQEK